MGMISRYSINLSPLLFFIFLLRNSYLTQTSLFDISLGDLLLIIMLNPDAGGGN